MTSVTSVIRHCHVWQDRFFVKGSDLIWSHTTTPLRLNDDDDYDNEYDDDDDDGDDDDDEDDV